METIKILTSKKKSFLLLVLSTVFVALGILMFLYAEEIASARFNNPIYIKGIGIMSVVFFSLGIFVGIKRIIKTEVAVIISPDGLQIKPEKSNAGLINWSDITGFEEIKIQSTRILIIGVVNPDSWLEKETSFLRRKLMQININNYNSPFNIAANGLDISTNELYDILDRYFNKYNKKVEA